jgi:hypothetical protein
MSTDLWEQLAEREVPAPPPQLARDVHRRLNKALLAMHLADLFLEGMAFAMAHFAQAVVHLIGLTFTGRMQPVSRKDRNKEGPPM